MQPSLRIAMLLGFAAVRRTDEDPLGGSRAVRRRPAVGGESRKEEVVPVDLVPRHRVRVDQELHGACADVVRRPHQPHGVVEGPPLLHQRVCGEDALAVRFHDAGVHVARARCLDAGPYLRPREVAVIAIALIARI